MTPLQELQQILDRWMRWFRIRRSLQWAAGGLALGLGTGLVLLLYAIVGQRLLADEFIRGAGSLALAGLLLGWLAGIAWPLDRNWAARNFDRLFGLKERVSTALEIAAAPDGNAVPLAEHQLEDALENAHPVQPARSLPLRLPRRALGLALLLAAIHLGFWNAAGDIFQRAIQQRQVEEAIAGEIEKLEAIVEEIRASPGLDEAQKEDLLEPLEQALQALSGAETLEEAAGALNEAEQSLRELENPAAEIAANRLEDIGGQLAQSEGPLESVGESLSQGNFEQAAEALRNIDPGSLDQAEGESLAEELEALADSVAQQDPALAESLRQAAQETREGNSQAAEQALQQAAEELEQLGEDAAASAAAEEAAEAVESGQQQLAQAGQQGEGQEGGAAGQPGQGEGAQTLEQGAQGSGDQPGTGGSGSGSGEGSQGAEGGSTAGLDPIGQGNSPDGAGESGFEPITPSSIGGEGSNWIAVPPSGIEGENVIGTGPTGPGGSTPSTVPYTEVLPIYQDAVRQAIENGRIPLEFRDLVRQYFSLLESN